MTEASVWILLLAAYFLPTIVAAGRHHHQGAAIFVLNLFLGWSGLGWIAALVWSATAVRDGHQVRGEL